MQLRRVLTSDVYPELGGRSGWDSTILCLASLILSQPPLSILKPAEHCKSRSPPFSSCRLGGAPAAPREAALTMHRSHQHQPRKMQTFRPAVGLLEALTSRRSFQPLHLKNGYSRSQKTKNKNLEGSRSTNAHRNEL